MAVASGEANVSRLQRASAVPLKAQELLMSSRGSLSNLRSARNLSDERALEGRAGRGVRRGRGEGRGEGRARGLGPPGAKFYRFFFGGGFPY